MPRPRRNRASSVHEDAQVYQHPTADLAARSEIGTQAHFKKAKPPTAYRYDSSRDLQFEAEFEDTAWEHLAGTVRAPFAAGDHGQVAVKVIDPRGNELLVVKKLEAER
jgi:hypothetical protein